MKTPRNILYILDNKGESFDRYTVVTKDREHIYHHCLCLSDNCDQPNGFSQWNLALLDGANYKPLGESRSFESLPNNVKKHIIKQLR